MLHTLRSAFLQHPVWGAALLVAVGGVLGSSMTQLIHSRVSDEVVVDDVSYSTEVREGGYLYINPLLECDVSQQVSFTEFLPASEAISSLAKEYENRGIITDYSVYFRDLNNGPWFGINEGALFAPASLYKVPLMIAILQRAEHDPLVLSRNIKFTDSTIDEIADQNVNPDVVLVIGQTYTVEQLLERMIWYSDNQSMELLLSQVEDGELSQLEKDLGLHLVWGEDGEMSISVKSYASIFRMLYNASYLNREMSEKALFILSGSKFVEGIPSGLPEDIEVAHKFGERVLSSDGVVAKQLHDCGVVYSAENPYLLCIMTRGVDLQQQIKLVRGISEIVYEDLERQHATK